MHLFRRIFSSLALSEVDWLLLLQLPSSFPCLFTMIPFYIHKSLLLLHRFPWFSASHLIPLPFIALPLFLCSLRVLLLGLENGKSYYSSSTFYLTWLLSSILVL
jgi:hypothetical protein